jgi:hypothetical protein
MAAIGKWIAAIGVAGCGDLHGLDPEPLSPLASIHVRVTGDIDAFRPPGDMPPRLRATLLWGQPVLPDPSCLGPIENPDHAELVAAACGDPLGFRRGGFTSVADVAVNADGSATLELASLPDLLYGDTFSQIVYGSVIIYDDVNGDRNLEPFSFVDVIYGASFASMAEPDTRVAFRHGGYDTRWAYYPRRGCEPPVEGYSLVSAGGFTLEQAIEAQARGELPAQDPAQCRQDAIDRELVVELRSPEKLGQVGCSAFAYYFSPPLGVVRPPGQPGNPDLPSACTSIPDRGTGRSHGRFQLLMGESFQANCPFIRHFVLRGCQEDPLCEVPEWDVPPSSDWPCPAEDSP